MVPRTEAVQLLTVLLLGALLLSSVAILHKRRGAEALESLRLLSRCRREYRNATAADASKSGLQRPQHDERTAYASYDSLQRPQCSLIVPDGHQSEGSGNRTFNPAGVFAPEVGWLVIARHEPDTWHMTWPMVWLLGKDAMSVNLQLANQTEGVWRLDNDTLGSGAAAKRGHAFIKAEDYRPFVWNGSVHTSFSMWSGDWHKDPVIICVSQMDVAQQAITTARCFDKLPLHKDGEIREKNWAFKELDGELYVLHKLAPVTTFLRVEPAAPKGLALVSATSFHTVPHRVQILSHAGLSFDEEVHISGHPVDFPRSLMGRAAADKGHSEWFVMAHRRENHVYQHWGFRISVESLELTHVTKGPILSPFGMDGDTDFKLIVGSYHFTKQDGNDSLTVFFGLADARSCVTNVMMDSVAWYRLPPGKRLALEEAGYQLS